MPQSISDVLEHRRASLVNRSGAVTKYQLMVFRDSRTHPHAISGTPFRKFESVPLDRTSSRAQNNLIGFDPYIDTVFDYPLIVGKVLGCDSGCLKTLNNHLVVQVPFCGSNCWHCYNRKHLLDTGDGLEIDGSTHLYSAHEILDIFERVAKTAPPDMPYKVLRISGGEPFLYPDLIVDILRLISNGGGHGYWPKAVWTETNLLPWIGALEGEHEDRSLVGRVMGSYENGLGALAKLSEKLVVHPCFHGTSSRNVAECMGNRYIDYNELRSAFGALHETFNHNQDNIPNIYPSFIAEASDPDGVLDLLDYLYRVNAEYPLRTALIPVDDYVPVRIRMRARRDTKSQFRIYSRFANLFRINAYLMGKFGISYGQIPRTLSREIANNANYCREPVPYNCGMSIPHPSGTTPYKPMVILVKSILRKEYKQELLSLLALPPGCAVNSTYDTKHLEAGFKTSLREGVWAFGDQEVDVLVVHGDPDKNTPKYLPLRWATLENVAYTEQHVHFSIRLRGYALPNGENEYEVAKSSDSFNKNLFDYFGVRTLLERPSIRWVLFGEKNVTGNEYRLVSHNGIASSAYQNDPIRKGGSAFPLPVVLAAEPSQFPSPA